MRLLQISGERSKVEEQISSQAPGWMKTDTKHEITNITRERHCSALYLAYASGMGCPHAHGMAWNGIYPPATLLLFNIGWSHDVRIHTYIPTGRTDIFSLSFLFSSSLSCYPCIYVSARARPS
jgi:hypothetical protein